MPERFIGAAPRRGEVRPGPDRVSSGFALKKWTELRMVADETRHRPPDGPNRQQQSPALAHGLPLANSDARGFCQRGTDMNLKPTQLFASLLAAAAVLALAAEAGAQGKGKTDTGNPGNSQGKGKPTIEQRPTVIPRDVATDPATVGDQKGKPATPGRPGQTQPAADVQTLVRDFQTAREKFLEDQKALTRQFQQASEEERKAIRERMKEMLDRLKEQQKALQQDMRDRAKELKQQLHPDLNRLIDNGTTEGGRGR